MMNKYYIRSGRFSDLQNKTEYLLRGELNTFIPRIKLSTHFIFYFTISPKMYNQLPENINKLLKYRSIFKCIKQFGL